VPGLKSDSDGNIRIMNRTPFMVTPRVLVLCSELTIAMIIQTEK
jgi:hypothetical protein